MDIQGLLLRWTMVSLSAGDGNWIVSYPMSSGAKLQSWRVTPALGQHAKSYTLIARLGRISQNPWDSRSRFLVLLGFAMLAVHQQQLQGFRAKRQQQNIRNSAHRSHRSLVLELEQESVASHRTVHWTDYWHPMVKLLVNAQNRGCNPITNHFGIFLLVHRNPQNWWKVELY